jgi:integrase
VVGKSEILRTLKTRDLAEANRLKHRVLAEINSWLTQFAAEATLPKDSADYVLAVAREMRDSVSRGESTEQNAEAALDATLEKHLDEQARKRGIDPESGHPLLDEAHERTLRLAHQVFSHGDVTLLSESIRKYLTEAKSRVTNAGYAQKERHLQAFAKWLKADTDVTTITRKLTGRYVSDVIQLANLSPKTKKDWIANLTAFGSWLEQYGIIEANPWRNLTRTIKESTRGGKPEPRPYTPEEFATLIQKLPAGDPLLPLSCISAYSGLRIEEIAAMKTEHVTSDAFRVMDAKNPNSVRYIPIHATIAPMISTLLATSKDGFLISGLLAGGADGKRSHYASKYFGDFLRKNGFTDRTLNFHSLRRSFAQRCEQAEVPEPTAQLLMGHARQSLTYGLYSPGPEFPKLQEAVGKVTFGAVADSFVLNAASAAEITRFSRRRKRSRLLTPAASK